MTDEPRSEATRADLVRDFPDWLPGLSKTPGMVDALWFATPDPVVLTDRSYAGLRKRIEKFQALFGDGMNSRDAERAANDLDTEL